MSLTERQQTLQRALSKFFREHYATDPNMTLSRNIVSHDIIPRNRAVVLNKKVYDTNTLEKMMLAGHGKVPHSQKSLAHYFNNPRIQTVIRKALYKKISTCLHSIVYKIPEASFIPIFFDMLNSIFGVEFDENDIEDCIRRQSIPTNFMADFTKYIKNEIHAASIQNLNACVGRLMRAVESIDHLPTIEHHKYRKSIHIFLKRMYL